MQMTSYLDLIDAINWVFRQSVSKEKCAAEHALWIAFGADSNAKKCELKIRFLSRDLRILVFWSSKLEIQQKIFFGQKKPNGWKGLWIYHILAAKNIVCTIISFNLEVNYSYLLNRSKLFFAKTDCQTNF